MSLEVFFNGYELESSFYYDQGHSAIQIEGAKAGSYEVKVDYDWEVTTFSARDYTVRTYYSEAIEVKDRMGKTNQVSMEYKVPKQLEEQEEPVE